MEAGLTRNIDLVWPLILGVELLLAGFSRPEGAVKVESASESLVSLVTEVFGGRGLLDWLPADLPCQEAGVREVPASITAALSLQKVERCLQKPEILVAAAEVSKAVICQEAGNGVPYLLGCSISSLLPFLGETSSVSCSELSAEYIGPSSRQHDAPAETQCTGVRPQNKCVSRMAWLRNCSKCNTGGSCSRATEGSPGAPTEASNDVVVSGVNGTLQVVATWLLQHCRYLAFPVGNATGHHISESLQQQSSSCIGMFPV